MVIPGTTCILKKPRVFFDIPEIPDPKDTMATDTILVRQGSRDYNISAVAIVSCRSGKSRISKKTRGFCIVSPQQGQGASGISRRWWSWPMRALSYLVLAIVVPGTEKSRKSEKTRCFHNIYPAKWPDTSGISRNHVAMGCTMYITTKQVILLL